MDEEKEYDLLIEQQFRSLPKVVQQAIISADVEKHLRSLAESHKLHLDQWGKLEDVVQMTLLGLKNSEELIQNIRNDVGVTTEEASLLAKNISEVVFEPIRQELERQLDHPEAHAEQVSDVEAARTQMLAAEPKPTVPTAATIAPATPPTPAPTQKVERAPVSEGYKSGETSAVRTSVHDDPYREPPA